MPRGMARRPLLRNAELEVHANGHAGQGYHDGKRLIEEEVITCSIPKFFFPISGTSLARFL
ncbi:hypothetical protein BQ8482_60002 [Mesorhizobium delmotii]|uniref:Uncharacterized protein n=1 Tax=Mesorhizobium delmotii TaxID=1631247 RepID=A0A2P9AUW8_9HYPH|nr:hypothetical protein BQ8482_60002 [Mesorhizobium delmotii]